MILKTFLSLSINAVSRTKSLHSPLTIGLHHGQAQCPTSAYALPGANKSKPSLRASNEPPKHKPDASSPAAVSLTELKFEQVLTTEKRKIESWVTDPSSVKLILIFFIHACECFLKRSTKYRVHKKHIKRSFSKSET